MRKGEKDRRGEGEKERRRNQLIICAQQKI